MNMEMHQFWIVLGEKYCKDKGYVYITKDDNIEDESKALHDDMLCVLNLDNSMSMSRNNKYKNAVAGAKVAVAHLSEYHLHKEKVEMHLWFNDCPGVECLFKGTLE